MFQTIENKQKFISQVMTSKSPVRSCDDVDETVLSYAEVKALCAGNPLIKEKVELEIELTKLKVLRGDYQSQQYRLSDSLTQTFPAEIAAARAAVASNTSDLAAVGANTRKTEEGISPMTIGGRTYTKRDEAGEALVQARNAMKGTDPEKIGDYRGLGLYISFDTLYREYLLHLKGEITHSVLMGESAGSITRLDNLIGRIPENIQKKQHNLDNLQQQVEKAKAALEKPFPQEADYQAKVKKLIEIDAALSSDGKPPVKPEPGKPNPARKVSLGRGESARLSRPPARARVKSSKAHDGR